jgi:hypothetical protein
LKAEFQLPYGGVVTMLYMEYSMLVGESLKKHQSNLGSWLMHLILQDLIRDPSAPKVEVGWL